MCLRWCPSPLLFLPHCRSMPRPKPKLMRLFLGLTQVRAKCTGLLAPRCTQFMEHLHSRAELCTLIPEPAKPLARFLCTRPAGRAATIHATRRCTKMFSKAAVILTSFFDQIAWKEKLHHKVILKFRCTESLFCAEVNMN